MAIKMQVSDTKKLCAEIFMHCPQKCSHSRGGLNPWQNLKSSPFELMVLWDMKYQKITTKSVSHEPEKAIKLAFLSLDPTELRRSEM